MSSRRSLYFTFLKIGFLGFGGPIAAMSLMERELFSRSDNRPPSLTRERFIELYALCKLLPGPVSTQLAVAIGRECAGTIGGWICGALFVLPSVALLIAISAFYSASHWIHEPAAQWLIQGLQLGALALIFAAAVQLSRGAMGKDPLAWIAFLVTLVVAVYDARLEPLFVLGFGVLAYLTRRKQPLLEAATLIAIAVVCIKGALITFGTGLAIVPLLQQDLVETGHYLTQAQFLDGLLFGQITPGPVLASVAFYGHQIAGLSGAWVGTICAFLPGFIIVLYVLPRVYERLRARAPRFLAGAVPAVAGGVFGAWLRLSAPFRDEFMLLAALVALASWKRMPPLGIILLGGAFQAGRLLAK